MRRRVTLTGILHTEISFDEKVRRETDGDV